MATVWVPGILQELTGGRETVPAAGRTVREVLDQLDREFPGFKSAIVKDGIFVKPGISVVVDGHIVQQGLLAAVGEHSEVFFVPAIGGG